MVQNKHNAANSPMKGSKDALILKPSQSLMTAAFFICLIVFIWGLYKVIQDPSINMQTTKPPMHWLTVIVAGSGTVFSLLAIFKKVPRLELTPTGITQVRLFKRESWQWSEVGPFSLDTVQIGHRFPTTKMHYACAFTTGKRNRIYERSGYKVAANHSNANILIPVSRLTGVIGSNRPNDILDLLNDWQSRLGTPDPEIVAETPPQDKSADKSAVKSIWS